MPPTARTLAAGPCVAAALLLAGLHVVVAGGRRPSGAVRARPALDVAVVADGLDHPWDVAQAPDGTLLFDERAGGFTAVLPDGTVQDVRADFGDLFARGETGLMGLVLDPGLRRQPALLQLPGRHGRRGGVDRRHRLDRLRRLAQRHPRRRPADRRHPGQRAAPGGTAAAGCGSPPTARC